MSVFQLRARRPGPPGSGDATGPDDPGQDGAARPLSTAERLAALPQKDKIREAIQARLRGVSATAPTLGRKITPDDPEAVAAAPAGTLLGPASPAPTTAAAAPGAAVPAPARRANPLQKSAEEITTAEMTAQLADMIKDAGLPLTGEGGALERPAEQRDIMILFENGLFLVSRSHMSDPYVLKLESYARLRGIPIDRKIGVPLDAIREAYYKAGGEKASASTTQMQRDITRLIEDAVHEDASDIHIVVEQTRCIVEMRMNGVLRQRLEWRAEYGSDFCAACFAMADASDANYNPNEYQAARISRSSADLPDTVQALRLQFNPLAYGGRYLIMRLLYRGSAEQRAKARGNVRALGYTEKQFAQIRKMIATPVGIGIVSGPTGSGKSTTLFHVLSTVMEECNYERNVLTIEDPPERPIFGAKQMPVTNAQTPEERSRKFIQAISAAMRSDPDTIMIGEVRDKQSAKLAIEAAMTGHQVWTTVHANDALMIVNRLRDIGVEEYNLFTPGMIFGLIGQRLARALCPNCKVPIMKGKREGRIPDDIWERLCTVVEPEKEPGIHVAGDGCEVCGGKKGYTGRTVVAEVLYPDEQLMQFLRQDNRMGAREYWLKHLDGVSMMQHAIQKMKDGVLTPAEIERVVGPIAPDF